MDLDRNLNERDRRVVVHVAEVGQRSTDARHRVLVCIWCGMDRKGNGAHCSRFHTQHTS